MNDYCWDLCNHYNTSESKKIQTLDSRLISIWSQLRNVHHPDTSFLICDL